ncbi:MAG: aminotransferase class III-fold pyridoxal phosphate-dependent enzyme, partial [Phycisphaerales bacterium]
IALLERSRDKLACLVLDLMPHRVGLNPADPEYVAALRDWTKKNGVLLLLDEVITLRSHYTGLQEQYGLRPDLTAMGKMIGGGFPIGAIAGRRDVMDVLNPRSKSYVYPHSGTFSANPISLTAGLAAMEKFDRSEVARLNGMAERAIASIQEMIRETGARASVTGGGSMFRVHMKATAPTNYREAHTTAEENKRVKVMLDHMFDAGFILINSCSCALSTPMGDAEVDDLLDAMRGGFEKIAAMP